MRLKILISAVISVFLAGSLDATAQGKRYNRIVIRNAMVVDGSGKPAAGPFDIEIEKDVIKQVVRLDPVAISRGSAKRLLPADFEIDASGKYVLPGLINVHAHTHAERGGKPMPVEYGMKLWLACGITTIRDVGASKATLSWREQGKNNEIASPRIYAYGRPDRLDQLNPKEAREQVRNLQKSGYDGIKLGDTDRATMQAIMDEAKKIGMRVAHHSGVAETNAWDDIKFGTTSIEHWYGIPDAAIESGRQNFPSSYNYNDEVDRFRYAGRLWREASWDRLMKVLDAMAQANVAWVPTLDIYEASRDLQRAQTNPAFAEYLHPVLEEYFKPNPANHGSYFIGWTSTDEAFWKENYNIWMRALFEFERRGGLIGAGDDAGFIYQLYGFGMIRELELHQEAGFNPLKVIQHATANNAKILGEQERLGRIKVGYKADLIVVNGNPLENFKVLYPTGIEEIRDSKVVKTGGIEWTIKDGIPFHAPTLAAEVREMVKTARFGAQQPSNPTPARVPSLPGSRTLDSMGGGNCNDNVYNCKDTPNPLPRASSVWLEEMTWMDVRDALAAGKTTIIIPTGGIEPNGPWLVLGKHNYVLTATCDAIARKMGNALCAPIIKHVPEGNIDPPSGHMTSPGTISLREDTFRALLTDTAESLKQAGFKQIFFIGDSGGNQAGQRAVAETLNAQFKDAALVAHIQEYYDYASIKKHMEQFSLMQTESDKVHDDSIISLNIFMQDPAAIRFQERVKAGKATINGVDISDKAKNTEWGKQIIAFRVKQTIDAFNKAIANKGTLPLPMR